jgi:LacI family transcriptional regulator
VTIADVARAANVSIATVSRALNDRRYPMRRETRERVLAAVRDLNFRPNPLARGMITKETRTVGLLLPDIANPYYPKIARGLEDAALARDYAVVVCNTDGQASKAAYYIDVLQKRVDGIIITGEVGDAAKLASLGANVVVIGRHDLPYPAIRIDNVAAARQATKHLIENGHRRIGVIAFPAATTSGIDRLAGFRAELKKNRIAYDPDLTIAGDFGEESGYRAARAFLSLPSPPTAILAFNDRMAIGVIAAASDMSVSIPNQLAVVGFDDIPTASFVRPALTSVTLPAHALGIAAMEAMLELLNGQAPEPVTWIPTTLETRESSSGNLTHAGSLREMRR